MVGLGSRLGLLFGSRLPWLVLAGVVLLGIVSNGFYEMARGFFESALETVIVGVLLLLLVIILAEPVVRVRAWIQGWLRTSTEIRADVRRRKGLIALVSQEHAGARQAVDDAIEYHMVDESGRPTLHWCWLIAGPGVGDPARQMLSSQEKAEKLQGELESMGIQARIIRINSEAEANDPLTTMALVNQAFSEAFAVGLRTEDVIADYTGGTKTMTAGMILACTSPERKLEFMKPRRYKPDGTADREAGSEPREVNIAFTLMPVEGKGS